jgi:hypothetical protein
MMRHVRDHDSRHTGHGDILPRLNGPATK